MAITELNEYGSQEERDLAYNEAEAQASTTKDYWDAVNVFAIKGTRPELRTTEDDWLGTPLNIEDEGFKSMVADSDVETQTELYKALGNEHAQKIYSARKVQREAMGRIQEDPLITQLAMGAIPALASPTSLIPIGGSAAAIFRVGKAASRMTVASRSAIAGALGGAVANAGDEYIIGQQALHTDYTSAIMFGAAFGGVGGFLGGFLAGPMGKANAEVSHGSSDTYKTDYVNDPDFVFTYSGESGTPRMRLAPQGVPSSKTRLQATGSTSTERQSKYLLDKIPFISDFLNSDITKAYMHESAVGRAVMTKLVTPSTALYDKVGNAIAVGRTAMDFKTTQKGINNRKDLAIDRAFDEAKKGFFMGNREDFIKSISDEYNTIANKQSMDLADYINTKLNDFDNKYGNSIDAFTRAEIEKSQRTGKAIPETDPLRIGESAEALRMKERRKLQREAEVEFYSNYKVEFKNRSGAINKGAEAYHKFYNEHLSSNKELGMSGTRSTNPNKLYAPRLMDWDKFGGDVNFIKKFENDAYLAFKSHGANSDLLESELRLLAKEYTEVIQNVEDRMQFTHGSFMAPTLSGDARMKGRKFSMDESIMSPYRMTDMEDLASRYHYQMSGRQAVHYAFGTDKIDDIMKKVIDDMRDTEGVRHDDMLNYIRNTVLDLSGQLRMNALSDTPAWQITRTIQVYNSARLGGGFGGNQFIELAASMFMNHLPSVLSGRLGRSFKQAGKALYTGTKDVDEFNMFLVNSGFMEDALHTSKVNRFADTEAGFNTGKIEGGLHKFTDWMYKYNGMRYFKSVMEDLTGGAMMREIPLIARKLSEGKLTAGESARVSRWGLDEQALGELADAINMHYKPEEGKLDLEAFGSLNRDRLQLAIQRGVAEMVIQGDSLHLPTWMKVPTPAKALLTQFMRFPMIAHSVYMRRGMTDDKARMAAAVAASTFTYMGMKYLREEASVALGLVDDRDRKYNYFDERKGSDAMMRGAIESTNYIAPLGMWQTAVNWGSMMGTGSEVGSDYRGVSDMESFMGPTFGGLGGDVLSLMQQAATGELSDERAAMKAKSLTPGSNLPIVNEGLKMLIEEGF